MYASAPSRAKISTSDPGTSLIAERSRHATRTVRPNTSRSYVSLRAYGRLTRDNTSNATSAHCASQALASPGTCKHHRAGIGGGIGPRSALQNTFNENEIANESEPDVRGSRNRRMTPIEPIQREHLRLPKIEDGPLRDEKHNELTRRGNANCNATTHSSKRPSDGAGGRQDH